MTEEEKINAAAYMKLQLDVRQLILDTVITELQANPYGVLSMTLQNVAANHARTIMDREIQNYRIMYRGSTANY